jgi:glycosyltransferase involved in cell wall biosynthesis
MKPKITILVPCFNQESIIRETIESALNQDYPYKKILCIDDASIDKTAEIVKEYVVQLIVNKKNLGFTQNFNKLIECCKTEYFIFLCGDDVFTDRRVVSDVVKILDDFPEAGVVGRNWGLNIY